VVFEVRFSVEAQAGEEQGRDEQARRECQDFCVWGGFRNWLMGKFYSSSGLSQAAAGAPG
jgi:hypothetical protein